MTSPTSSVAPLNDDLYHLWLPLWQMRMENQLRVIGIIDAASSNDHSRYLITTVQEVASSFSAAYETARRGEHPSYEAAMISFRRFIMASSLILNYLRSPSIQQHDQVLAERHRSLFLEEIHFLLRKCKKSFSELFWHIIQANYGSWLAMFLGQPKDELEFKLVSWWFNVTMFDVRFHQRKLLMELWERALKNNQGSQPLTGHPTNPPLDPIPHQSASQGSSPKTNQLLRVPPQSTIQRSPILPDGHCQFSALADQLHRSGIAPTATHVDVRRLVASWLRSHPNFVLANGSKICEYALMKGDCTDWEGYCNAINRLESPEWGDHLTLQAAAEVFDCLICVVNEQGILWTIMPTHSNKAPGDFPQNQTLYLLHYVEYHYESLEPFAIPQV
ncbi:uncharacterized protein BJ171DRAFT_501171 [Polychytrium aggregatum]|uniref:uncharacterized protein n=1 Tax=Polychytrium aggregatum TaxID=110093 RepID=UPI0022FE323C|nr:uncharacterized protein BJ171DRAFT_501171 [Polychytrium aggregatum]KAI9205677.1 hypothetical protein BJ171DRAFT_501171 [Polychytrium aggregatum]